MQAGRRWMRVVIAAVPVVMLTFAVPFVNTGARVYGWPILIVWISAWVIATPLFLLAIRRVEMLR